MLMLRKEDKKNLPKLYSQDGKGDEAIAYVKYFMTGTNWTWYATEYDGNNDFFGLVVGQDVELGYFLLSELKAYRGQFGLGIERDLHFRPTKIGILKKKHNALV